MDGNGWTIGRRLREIRFARRKSLRVVAGLAGISPSYLSRLESGERALDRRSLIVALANALEIAPSELTEVTLPAAGDTATDADIARVRQGLLTVGMGGYRPAEALPADVLRARVAAVLHAQQTCRHRDVAAALPALVIDLHTAIAAGRDDAELLRLAVLLHVQGTQAWLRDVGAPLDLGWSAATMAQSAAERLDEPRTLGVAIFGTTHGLMAAGAFDLAGYQLARARVGTADDEAMQTTGMLAFTSSLLAAARRDQARVDPPLQVATELAERTGEGNAAWFGFGPTNVGVWRMAVALESGDHPEAVRVAETLDPRRIPSPQRRAVYWGDYGRALAQVRGRREDAVLALRRAERISSARVRRHPFTRVTLAELLNRPHRDTVGRELRGMAYRAGLPV